ncbi:MAG TPA: hypothetical protein DEA96_18855 [Leptospiraceae bacterium]|nr:hypothetical protein [Spirochaetaceae bacterium]HBS07039.1 hypothetical protein [Leptospiraceae bacterium]
MNRTDSRKQGLALFQKACLILITGLFLFRAPSYAPDTEFIIGGFSSDTGIPVLMSNSDYFSPFSLYYWGQDRFGSWPFLLFSMVGSPWSPLAIFLGMYIYLHLSLLVMLRNRSPLLLLAALTLLHSWRPLGGFLFDIAQPYGWQLGSIFLGISLAEGKSKSWKKRVTLFIISFLAIWLSPSSVLYLIAIPLIRIAILNRSWIYRALQGLKDSSPVILAYAAHSMMRRFVVNSNAASFYEEYETPLKWKAELVAPAWNAVKSNIFQNWEILLWVAGMIILMGALYSLLTGRGRRHVRMSIPALALIAGSILFLVSILPLNWFTLNQYGARYLALPRFLMLLGLLLFTGRWIINMSSTIVSIEPALRTIGSGSLSILILFAFWSNLPERKESAHYRDRLMIARSLEQKYPGIPLLGNYWETYVYSALQTHRNLPQPGPGQYQRTPFLLPAVLGADQLIVNHRGFPISSTESGAPVKDFRFRGQQYVLVDSDILNGSPLISVYRKLNRK